MQRRETFLGSPSTPGGVLPLVIEEPQAEVQPLHSRAPKEILLGQEQPDLPQASLAEHFERISHTQLPSYQAFDPPFPPFLLSLMSLPLTRSWRPLATWPVFLQQHK